jgi:hypothetical protein
MRICVLGGGGNVAEAVSALLHARGHVVYQYRPPRHVDVQGVPIRPSRNSARLNSSSIELVGDPLHDLSTHRLRWIDIGEFSNVDTFVCAFPSYLATYVGRELGAHIQGRPFINLSDRFLGTYDMVNSLKNRHGFSAGPSICVAFNGVPVMAQKATRDAPLTVYYFKRRHSIAVYPSNAEAQGRALLEEVFGLGANDLRCYETMLHLAFENAHCVEHSVVDLENVSARRYASPNKIYSQGLYTDQAIRRIDAVLADRDNIASAVVGGQFASLRQYDLAVFGGYASSDPSLAGTQDFRIHHANLMHAPSPMSWGAFGFEDTGWSMVTLESFARLFGVQSPSLTKLIDDWCARTQTDYRVTGRTVRSLQLLSTGQNSPPKSYTHLTWQPGFLSQSIALPNHLTPRAV